MSVLRSVAVAAAALLASAGALASPAQAIPSGYTPNGGLVSVSVINISFTPVGSDQVLSCGLLDLSGGVIDPGVSRSFGEDAVSLDDLSGIDCSNSFTPSGSWSFAFTGVEAGTVSPAQVNLSLFIGVAGCSFNIAGAIEGDFDEATQVFSPGPPSLIIADTPVGFLCSTLGLSQGQKVEVSGSWQNVGFPPLTVTNP